MTLVDGYSVEMATILCVAIICGYTMIGGLGATFYASYFNTAFIFIGMLTFFYYVYIDNNTRVSNDPLGN